MCFFLQKTDFIRRFFAICPKKNQIKRYFISNWGKCTHEIKVNMKVACVDKN